MIVESIDEIFEFVKLGLLSKSAGKAVFINVDNNNDYIALKNKLSDIIDTVRVSEYCKNKDVFPDLSKLFYDCSNMSKPTLLLGFTQDLKIRGKSDFDSNFRLLLNSTLNATIFILCYQVSGIFKALINSDLRLNRNLIALKCSQIDHCTITFINCDNIQEDALQFDGYKSYLNAFESNCVCDAIVISKIANNLHSDIMIEAQAIDNPFDAMLSLNLRGTNELKQEYGTIQQWNWFLRFTNNMESIDELFTTALGDSVKSENCFSEWSTWDENLRWLFYINLLINSTKNKYLLYLIKKTKNYANFLREVYFAILDFDYCDENYHDYYNQRKVILNNLKDSSRVREFCDYCKKTKSIDRLNYLTDSSEIEKQEIITCLSEFDIIDESVIAILSYVYKDLAMYLSDYDLGVASFNQYFNIYKKEKVNNKIYDGFIDLVNENAISREFNNILEPTTKVFESIDKTDSPIYFIDALGVEFIGYIKSICDELNLHADIQIAKANLPSATEYNKEFLNGFEYKDIKTLDTIKHKGEKDYSYETNKLPIYLIQELKIIKNIFIDIKADLSKFKKVIVVSDHGASRLIVINQVQNSYDVSTAVSDGGRCCEYSKDMKQIQYSTIENNHFVLANYDRFKTKGGPRFETHGGATLEEVIVPIIEIKLKNNDIFAKITNKKLLVSFRNKAELIIYANSNSSNLKILINKKSYLGDKLKQNLFRININDITKAGEYKAEIFIDNNSVGFDTFSIEKEAGKTSDLGI